MNRHFAQAGSADFAAAQFAVRLLFRIISLNFMRRNKQIRQRN